MRGLSEIIIQARELKDETGEANEGKLLRKVIWGWMSGALGAADRLIATRLDHFIHLIQYGPLELDYE